MYFKYKYMLPDRENKLKLILVFTRFPVVVLLVKPVISFRGSFTGNNSRPAVTTAHLELFIRLPCTDGKHPAVRRHKDPVITGV